MSITTCNSSSDYDVWEVGLKPGLKVNLSNHVAFVTKIGFFGYQRVDEANTWGVNLDGRNILFGINYKGSPDKPGGLSI